MKRHFRRAPPHTRNGRCFSNVIIPLAVVNYSTNVWFNTMPISSHVLYYAIRSGRTSSNKPMFALPTQSDQMYVLLTHTRIDGFGCFVKGRTRIIRFRPASYVLIVAQMRTDCLFAYCRTRAQDFHATSCHDMWTGTPE